MSLHPLFFLYFMLTTPHSLSTLLSTPFLPPFSAPPLFLLSLVAWLLSHSILLSFTFTFNSAQLLLDCKLMEKRKQPPTTPTADDTHFKRLRSFPQEQPDTFPHHFHDGSSMSTIHSYHAGHILTPWLPLVTEIGIVLLSYQSENLFVCVLRGQADK